ncbi:hypothetical protein DUI87_15467 [Hirundo rustica rustica]|uniref:KBD domain-containing protein n=1 Tax=Hirundo rustica rustica TaxID=333673 RepID=A0A3M0K3Z1_HIRRU|nr:hypothetical protein DUI87_15467 [Hirundo rustica rustica]
MAYYFSMCVVTAFMAWQQICLFQGFYVQLHEASSGQVLPVLQVCAKSNATDSSSNSSQKREQPVRTLASPASCEHRRICTRGHLHDHYSSDHYHLEQSVGPRSYRHVNFPDDDEEIVRINPREKIWMTGYKDYRHAPARGKSFDPDDMDSYVRFAKSEASKHEYTYPYVDNSDFDLGEDTKVAVIKTQPVKFKARRKEDDERSRCVYCRDMFNHEENKRGQCQDAPDRVKTWIHRVSCMWCADTMLCHCMSDPEGDYTDPCSCDTSDEMFCLRWMALIALSFIAPSAVPDGIRKPPVWITLHWVIWGSHCIDLLINCSN